MAQPRHTVLTFPVMAAMALAVAVMAVSAAPAVTPTRELAAEMLILRGDLHRLHDEPDLSAKNRDGLHQRIAGALGLLPWLLRQADDVPTAERVRTFQGRSLEESRDALIALLDGAIARHPLDRAAFMEPPPTPARLREARAIHNTYCTGCHDDAGKGSPDLLLPARDLFMMARKEPVDEFLARMANGVKGDATIHFANPLTNVQIGALSVLYRTRAP